MRRPFATITVLILAVIGLSGQISDGGAGFSRGSSSLTSDNTWNGAQTYTVNPPTLGQIIFDATAYNNGTDGKWPLIFKDIWIGGPSGTDPGDPSAGFNHMGQFWTGRNITLSLHTVGDIDDLDFHPLGTFETSTASGGTITYLGSYTSMLDCYSDVDGPSFKLTTPGALNDGSLIAGGTRTPGVDNAVLTFAVGKDGTIYAGNESAPYISNGVLMSPEKQNDLTPMLWYGGEGIPTSGGKFTILGEATINKLGQVAGGAVSNQGTAGATTYTYVIVPDTTAGLKGVPSSNITTATGHATLDGTNYNRLTWTRKLGVANYYIYRTVGGATQGLIGSVAGNASAMQFDDTGLAGGGETTNTVDPTGDFTVQGEIAGAPLQWQAQRASITADDTMLDFGNVQMTTSAPILGFRTRGSGSILGISFSAGANSITSGSGTPRVQLYSGGSAISGCVADFGSALPSSGTAVRNGAATFTRGTYTWSGNQTLGAALDLNGASIGTGNITICVTVYMCYD